MAVTVIFDNPEYATGKCIFDNEILTTGKTRPYRKGWADWSSVREDDEEIILLLVTIETEEFR